jgi:ABC-type transport system substrate-binding protein
LASRLSCSSSSRLRLYHSSKLTSPRRTALSLSQNFTRVDDPAITSAMNDFRGAADPDSRVNALKTVQHELATNQPMIFLVHARAALAIDNNVPGLHATTFRGSDKSAMAPYNETPFYGFAWRDPAG